MAADNHHQTPALALFTEAFQLANAVLADVTDLARTGRLEASGPYSLEGLDIRLLGDDNATRSGVVRDIARSAGFPFEIQNLVPAIRRGERYFVQAVGDKPRAHVPGHLGHANRLIVQVLELARRMVLTDPAYARVAFELSPAEIEALHVTSGVTLVEAATHVRLAFKAARWRHLLALQQTLSDQPSVDKARLVPIATRLAGVSLLARAEG